MALLKILTYGHPLLRERAKELAATGERERDLIAAMAETMYENGGIGLAATQVGWMARLFLADVGPGDGGEVSDDDEDDDDAETDGACQVAEEDPDGRPRHLRVFINPQIIEESPEDEPFSEGCLSIPEVRGEVFRPLRVRVRARDENFEPFEFETGGLLARVIQHELDHLDGVLFVDKLPLLKRSLLAGQLNRIKQATLDELPTLGEKYPIFEEESLKAEG
jgi:peptide deformylase